MSNKTIYDYEPNYDDFEWQQQNIIRVLYKFKMPMTLTFYGDEDREFLLDYTKKNKEKILCNLVWWEE